MTTQELVPTNGAGPASTAIVPSEPRGLRTWEPNSIGEALGLAEYLAKSSIIPTALRGNPGNVLAVMMFGRELGMSTMQALLGIWIEPKAGRPTMYSQTLVGLVKQSKLCEWFVCEETNAERATFATQRRGSPGIQRLTVTIGEFEHLFHKDNWKGSPAAMLRSRCAMGLARMVYEEIAAGIYDPDELDIIEATVTPPPEKITAPPPPAKPAPAPRARAAEAPVVTTPAAPSTPPPAKKPARAEKQGDPPPADKALDDLLGPTPKPAKSGEVDPVRDGTPPPAEPPSIEATFAAKLRACTTFPGRDAVAAEVAVAQRTGEVDRAMSDRLLLVYREVTARIEASK